MAVEIINTPMYNEKADVFSWAMVFFEMLYLQKPFPTYSMDDHRRLVCEKGERPPLPTCWPQSIRNLLQHAWSDSVQERLSMKEAHCLLRSILESFRMLEAPESPVAVNDTSLVFTRVPYFTPIKTDPVKDTRLVHCMHDISASSDACSLLNTSLLGMTMTVSMSVSAAIVPPSPICAPFTLA